ncbi:MAG: hypothetical protein H8D97_00775 [Proteobacteria bacterium]|nr:hypothetical protein [Pseudomonadota bacterium]
MKCIKRGHLFKQIPPDHLRSKYGCPICATENHPGGYSIELFNDKPRLKNISARLYFYNFYNDIEDFYKIGITAVNERKFEIRKYYKIRLISEIKTTLYDAFLKEQKFIEDFKEFKYIPNIKFYGWTECFDKNIYSVLF